MGWILEKENMKATDWDIYFDGIACEVAKKSKDPQTKLGCVIISRDHSIITTGFNGFCRGVIESIPERWSEREIKYKFVEHAERNAIYNHARHGGAALFDSIAYIPVYPCIDCAKGLIQSGIRQVRMNMKRVNQRHIELEKRLGSFLFESHIREKEFVYNMFTEAGVDVGIYEME